MTTTLWRTDAPTEGRPGRRWWRIAVLVAVVIGAAYLLGRGGQPGSDAAYHPENPSAKGAQAVARVLAAHGVTVIVAEGQAALQRAPIDGDTTIVVSKSSDLREVTLQALATAARPAERLVLIHPERRVVRALTPGVSMAEVAHSQNALVSTCDTPDVHPGERLSRSQSQYRDTRATASCYINDGQAVYLVTSGPGLREVVLIGSTVILVVEPRHLQRPSPTCSMCELACVSLC